MSSAKRPPSGDASRQPWTPDAAPKGVACPACGLANEPGARTCRNCGLPIAAAGDPLRGVTPGHVDLPRARRSGLSATIGFVLVIGLLLVGGSLAVSGGGILSTGGRLGGGAEATPTPAPAVTITDPLTGEVVTPVASGEPEAAQAPKAKGTSFDYTCSNDAIKDLSRGKWQLNEVQAGVRTADDDSLYDQIYWKLSRTTEKKTTPANATTVSMLVMTPREAQEKYGLKRVQGNRALVVTFNGPVTLTANRSIEEDDFDNEGIEQVRRLQLFEGKDGKVRTVIGLRSESCARMQAVGWKDKKDAKTRNARINLDIERF